MGAEQVKQRVQSILAQNFLGVTLGPGDALSLQQGSARAFVRVQQLSDGAPTIITITVPLLSGVRDDAAVHEYVAFHADDYVFGNLSLYRQADGRVDVFITHKLLGDYLDEAELGYALTWIIETADDLDDELQSQFGGNRFHES